MSRTTDLLAGPRRRVRYVRLLDAWPECPRTLDPDRAILEAPADACLEAMGAEVDHYRELLNEERARGDRLEAELNGLRVAAQTIARLFEDRPE